MNSIEIRGDPRSRGREHGESRRSDIQTHIEEWLAALGREEIESPLKYVGSMLRETDFVSSSKRYTLDVLQEVTGIAEGAGIEPDIAFALQLIDEEWAYRFRRNSEARPLQKCSSLAIQDKDGSGWIAQNMDLGAYTDTHQLVLRIGAWKKNPAAIVFSLAGVVGLMGTNSEGVGVCVNSLPQLPAAARGVPVAFVLRNLLQARSARAAAARVRKLPHATHQHYLIADASEIFSIEASATGVTAYSPEDTRRVFHTNHPLAQQPYPAASQSQSVNSVARLHALTQRLSLGEPNLERIQAALSSCDDPLNPVCRLRSTEPGLINFTSGSMISRVRHAPASCECWVASGPPNQGCYEHMTLARGKFELLV